MKAKFKHFHNVCSFEIYFCYEEAQNKPNKNVSEKTSSYTLQISRNKVTGLSSWIINKSDVTEQKN